MKKLLLVLTMLTMAYPSVADAKAKKHHPKPQTTCVVDTDHDGQDSKCFDGDADGR